MKEYLIINNFYVRNDLKSFLLFLDYFQIQAYILRKHFTNPFFRKLKYQIFRTIYILLFLLKIYDIRYKKISLNSEALIIFNGVGKLTTKIKLVERDGKCIIIKKVFNKKIFLKEMEFYKKYNKNESAIRLPKHVFLKENIIEIDFLKFKSFQRLIVDGSLSFSDVMKYFSSIKSELQKFYSKNKNLIHGDFWLTNIFLDPKRNYYYLIDYSDSNISIPKYDLYVLLFSILATYNKLSLQAKSIKESNELQLYEKLLGINRKELARIELKFRQYRQKRFQSFYK